MKQRVKLNSPVTYADKPKKRICEEIEIREPTGADSDFLFAIFAGLSAIAQNEQPMGYSQKVIDFVTKFGSIADDPEGPVALVAQNLGSSDIFMIGQTVVEVFMEGERGS